MFCLFFLLNYVSHKQAFSELVIQEILSSRGFDSRGFATRGFFDRLTSQALFSNLTLTCLIAEHTSLIIFQFFTYPPYSYKSTIRIKSKE